MKKIIILLISLFIASMSFNCVSCLPTSVVSDESEVISDEEIEEPKNDKENINKEELSQESKISDYNDRLAEFSSLLNQINDMYDKHFLTVIYPITQLENDEPEEIISNAEQIIEEFELWQDDLSTILSPDYALNMVNYLIDFTEAGIEYFTYSKENPINYSIITMNQLEENSTSTFENAANERDRIKLNFNNEAEELGLEIPFLYTDTPSEEPSEEKESEVAEETFVIGDVVKIGDFIFTVNSARWEEGDEWFEPEGGEKWLVLDCTIENEGSKSISISSLLMFELYDEDSYSRDMELFADTKGSLDGELSTGRKMRGEIAFSVEEDQSYWEFIFKPEIFGSGQVIFIISENEVQ